MGTLVAVFAALAAVLVLLLAVPVDLRFRIQGERAIEGRLGVRWLFGCVRLQLQLPGRSRQRRMPARRRWRTTGKARSKRDRTGGRRLWQLLRQPAFRRRVVRLLGDVVRAAHLREIALHLRLGLDDPADTGRLWAVVGPLSALAQAQPHVAIRIEPQFVDASCAFEAEGRAVLVPIQFVALAVAFVFSGPSIRAWRSLRTAPA